jgi:hypothetical protein
MYHLTANERDMAKVSFERDLLYFEMACYYPAMFRYCNLDKTAVKDQLLMQAW